MERQNSLSGVAGKGDGEVAALALPALHRDRALHPLDELLGDLEAEAVIESIIATVTNIESCI